MHGYINFIIALFNCAVVIYCGNSIIKNWSFWPWATRVIMVAAVVANAFAAGAGFSMVSK